MKKNWMILAFVFLTAQAFAQYKKVGYFGKSGRTYDLGTQLYALGNGQGTPLGFTLGFGRDLEGKRFFYSWDIQYLPSYKYSYTTQDLNNNSTVSVNGKTRSMLSIGIDYCVHILPNTPDNHIKPYAFLGTNVVVAGGIKSEEWSANAYNPKKQTNWSDLNSGIHGGLGCLVQLNDTWAIKVQGGYSYRFLVNLFSSGEEQYTLFGSHPFVGAGVRLRIPVNN
jgi:hypothetical protein